MTWVPGTYCSFQDKNEQIVIVKKEKKSKSVSSLEQWSFIMHKEIRKTIKIPTKATLKLFCWRSHSFDWCVNITAQTNL